MKINVDGVATAICRDPNGQYLGSSAVVFDGTTDPTILETLACREAMVLANDLGWQRFFVASDCQGVVEDIDQSSGGLHGVTFTRDQ